MKKYLLLTFCFLSLTTVIHGMFHDNNYIYDAVQLGDKSVSCIEMKDLHDAGGAILIDDLDVNTCVTTVAHFSNGSKNAMVGLIKNAFQDIINQPQETSDINKKLIADFSEKCSTTIESLHIYMALIKLGNKVEIDAIKKFWWDCDEYTNSFANSKWILKKGEDLARYSVLIEINEKGIGDPRFFKSYKGKM